MTEPLLSIRNLWRSFPTGGETVDILKGINLDIYAGEMVAIIGQSGSGKSTLMNILGCLIKPSKGSYHVAGHSINDLDIDELARLRREYFGFIFQRYHLLGDLTASENVQIPAIYSGVLAQQRSQKAEKILARLGMQDRIEHKPGQLSGGQQQRVSIARALINGGEVILADEPTGALDSKSGQDVMKILRELNKDGHTVILVTHDKKIAENADRIIEIKDGEIVDEVFNKTFVPHEENRQHSNSGDDHKYLSFLDRSKEAFKMAVRSILAHRLRSFLTMLGIIIGIASVVSVVALGNGSQQEVLQSISSMGTNTIEVFRGKPGSRMFRSFRVRSLTPQDANVLAQQPFVDSVTPMVFSGRSLVFNNVSTEGSVEGVGENFFRVKNVSILKGHAFSKNSVDSYALEVVIDENTVKSLFKDINDPIGQVLLIRNVPVTVIGIAKDNNADSGGENNPKVWIPYTSMLSRIMGQTHLSHISVRIKDDIPVIAAEQAIHKILLQRHGKEDFSLRNTDTLRLAVESVSNTLTFLISSVAVISLIVGGIGVMNIMLVSVIERTQEIGVRMAVGARQSDIMQQFLIESVLLCLVGGLIGILLSLGMGFILNYFNLVTMVYSLSSIVIAFICATVIGITFGFLPAKNAAKLDPVVALSRE